MKLGEFLAQEKKNKELAGLANIGEDSEPVTEEEMEETTARVKDEIEEEKEDKIARRVTLGS